MGIKIEKVERYTLFCDGCGKEFDDEMWHEDEYTIKFSATESEWKEIDNGWYCPQCYELNEDEDSDKDYIVIKNK